MRGIHSVDPADGQGDGYLAKVPPLSGSDGQTVAVRTDELTSSSKGQKRSERKESKAAEINVECLAKDPGGPLGR